MFYITGEIDEKKSMFVYEEGKSHEDYQNNSFTPRFLDEIDVDKRVQAEVDCNGAENIECVFDLVFTENKDVANATRILKTDADLDRNEISKGHLISILKNVLFGLQTFRL
jgi:hypothetical protein